jgi:lipopolysaccharide transport system ATP-binding protein
MSNPVIQVEQLSKIYRLGTLGTGSLRQDIARWWNTKVHKKENTFFETNNAIVGSKNNQYLWALKDVNFEIKEGEVWGIVGKNGAGKSTLLKILSRISKPSEGIIRGRGKVSSLLEVGTGFHQELTGRENIFISGSMLGMQRKEIQAKFDEIVEFSGVAPFLDTPVKRYSSGMYVRLAFAVAAHLEPDILIVDEVLAVGDAEFQKKCLGKMKDVSTHKGRTIIFVSHNLQAINNLCSKALWLDHGRVKDIGNTSIVINKYLNTVQKKLWKQEWGILENAPGNKNIKMQSVELIPKLPTELDPIDIRTELKVRFRFYNNAGPVVLSVDILLFTLAGECIFDIPTLPKVYDTGLIEGECTIPGNFLNDGAYYFSLYFAKDTSQELFNFEECLHFEVEDFREQSNWYGKWWGYVRPQFPFDLKSIS